MPNWCSNTLYVTGDALVMQRMIEAVQDDDTSSDLSLEKILPTPQELKDGSATETVEETMAQNLERFGAKDWYDWRVENWGTKWDVEAEIEDLGEYVTWARLPSQVQYTFESAWAPPIEAIRKLSQQYPELHFALAYEEEGMGFGGYVVIENGETTQSEKGGAQRWAEEAYDALTRTPSQEIATEAAREELHKITDGALLQELRDLHATVSAWLGEAEQAMGPQSGSLYYHRQGRIEALYQVLGVLDARIDDIRKREI